LTGTALLAAFEQQAAWCDASAPFTAHVLRASRQWLATDAAAQVDFSALAEDPLAAAVPLRWVGGLHLLALQGQQPWAGLWPPANGAADAGPLDAAIRLAWQTRRPLLRDALSRPPQTNEAQRSAALLPGLLHIAAATGLPLALLEMGASAGLNLWCDRYRLAPATEPAWAWGDASAAVTLRPAWTGPPPWRAEAGGRPPSLDVRHRAACDAYPVDLRQPAEALRLASFIWPEQTERLARLRAAQAAVAGWMTQEGVQVQALPAAAFVQRELQRLRPGVTTVLMHSVVWQYIAAAEQQAIIQAMQEAAAHATLAAPLAWLRFEPDGPQGGVELICQLWPYGSECLLARCHPHAQHITWLHSA
jgi:hypothetical protein